MALLFSIVAVWVCLMSMAVFTQTKSYGHLMISLGAALTVSVYLFKDDKSFAELMLIAGDVLFWGGMAVIATFGRALEAERLRSSSWKEILLGRVPEHLQRIKISERSQVIQGTVIALAFALLFYFGHRQEEAVSFLVMAIVYGAYLGSLGFGQKNGSK